MDFRGFDSSIILDLRGGIPRPIGNFPESLSQAILAGIILVGRLGVRRSLRRGVQRRAQGGCADCAVPDNMKMGAISYNVEGDALAMPCRAK